MQYGRIVLTGENIARATHIRSKLIHVLHVRNDIVYHMTIPKIPDYELIGSRW
jgi:hypothetical protein